MSERIDVLAAMDDATYVVHNCGCGFLCGHAYRIEEARAAAAELIAAANAYFTGYCVDEAEDSFDCSDFGHNTGCSREQSDDAKRLRAALARIGATP